MKINEGKADRVLRTVLAAALIVAAVVVGATELTGILLLVVAAVLLVTAVVGVCPAYRLLGINTCPIRTESPRTPTGAR